MIALHVHYLQKERIGFVVNFFYKYAFGPKVVPIDMSSSSQIQESS